jgi:hypothetical protein
MQRLFMLALVAPLALLSACHHGSADAGATAEASADALVMDHDDGSVAWSVDPSGKVSAVVTGKDGKPVTENVSGALAWKDGGDTKTIPLTADATTHALVAEGPKLSADITEVGYTLSVGGKPWSGTLDLPPGGTAELAADAKASASVEVDVKAAGPHGGRIAVVGKDRA